MQTTTLRGSVVLSAALAVVLLATAGAPLAMGSVSEPKPSGFIGRVTSAALDTDHDGLFDRIEVHVALNVTSPVLLSVRAIVRIPPANASAPAYTMDNGTDVNASAESASATIGFDTDLISILGQDGPYRIDVFVYRPYFGGPLDQTNVSTEAWKASQFEGPAVRLSAPITDEGRDVHGDGRFDEIVIHVPFQVLRATEVLLVGQLSLSTSGATFNSIGPSPQGFLAPGSYVWDLAFDTVYLYRFGVNGPYIVALALYRGSGPGFPDLARASYRTQAYVAADLARPSADFVGPPTWTPVDPDGTGRAAFLDVSVPLRVRLEGNYSVSAGVLCSCFPPPYPGRTRYLHLLPGTQSVDVRLSGVALSRYPNPSNARVGVGVANLDGVYDDRNATSVPYPDFNASHFQPRDPVTLRLTTLVNGTPVEGFVELLDPVTAYDVQPTPPSSGPVSIPAYNGTFLLHVFTGPIPGNFAFGSTTVRVVVSGNTTIDVTIPRMACCNVSADLRFDTWSEADQSITQDWSAMSPYLRWVSDLGGDMNGVANGSEMALALLEVPWRFLTLFPGWAKVDGSPLTPVWSTASVLSGAGDTTSAAPVVTETVTHLHANGVVESAVRHKLNLTLSYLTYPRHERLDVELPANASGVLSMATRVGGSYQGFYARANATVRETGPGSWSFEIGNTWRGLEFGPLTIGIQATGESAGGTTGVVPLLEIGLGIAAVAVAAVLLVFFILRRRKREAPPSPPPAPPPL